MSKWKKRGIEKEDIVLFNGRHSIEKHPEMFEMLKNFRPDLKYIDCVGEKLSREEYFEAMARSRVVVSFADEETFGSTEFVEAFIWDALPAVPDRFAIARAFQIGSGRLNFRRCRQS